jgi:hypothetical protein
LSMSKDSQRKEERIQEILQILGFKIEDLKRPTIEMQPHCFAAATRKEFILNYPPDEFFIGVLDGDGSFSVNFHENGKITVNVEITTGINELQLLEHFKTKLNGIGSIHKRKSAVIR